MGRNDYVLKKVLYACALMIAIFSLGYFFNYKIGNLGYVSLADVFIMLFSNYFIPSYAMLIAAIPCTLCDLVLGYNQYALYTFIIKAFEGYSIGYLLNKNKKFLITSVIIGLITALLSILTDIYLYGNDIMSISLKKNLIQQSIVLIIVNIIYYSMKKIRK